MVEINSLFSAYKLNDAGKMKASMIASNFNKLLEYLQAELGPLTASREFALCKTHLEEACFYAKKAMAVGNQEPEE